MIFPTRRAAVCVILCLFAFSGFAQTIGIGTDFPTATLDIRSSDPISSLYINRNLGVSAASNPAVNIIDASDYRVMDLKQSRTTNTQEVMRITQSGLGEGMYVAMSNSSSSQEGLKVGQTGLGDAMFLYLTNAAGTNDALQIYTFGDSQKGIRVDNRGYSAWGLLNLLDDGIGMYNLYAVDGGVSVFTDMYDKDGSGYFFSNIDLSSYYGSGTVTGEGDGYALDVFINTATPSVGSTVYGGVIGADQFGVGHGILVNHSGTGGRNAEFNSTNSANADPTIFATHSGLGSVLVAQQQNTAVGSDITVADISYIGTENRDHIAVSGYSAPVGGRGYGGQFTGGKYGVVGQEATGAAISGVHAVGDLSASGLKPFIIDHPLDPENMYLRHFAIESNEALNMYRGVALISRSGRAVVRLPEYFSAININISYQLTAIGTNEVPWVDREVSENEFVIGGKPGTKVSWTIYASRNDAYVKAHPQKTADEFYKDREDKGRYMDPVSHGQPAAKGIFFKEQHVLEATRRTGADGTAREAYDKAHRNAAEVKTMPQSVEAGRRPEGNGFQPMQIKQEIKTWDELK